MLEEDKRIFEQKAKMRSSIASSRVESRQETAPDRASEATMSYPIFTMGDEDEVIQERDLVSEEDTEIISYEEVEEEMPEDYRRPQKSARKPVFERLHELHQRQASKEMFNSFVKEQEVAKECTFKPKFISSKYRKPNRT
jgi:hypothetical protein